MEKGIMMKTVSNFGEFDSASLFVADLISHHLDFFHTFKGKLNECENGKNCRRNRTTPKAKVYSGVQSIRKIHFIKGRGK